jgi:hypothetical protein
MKRFFAILIICAAMAMVAGCYANIEISKMATDGTVFKAKYTRWFHQSFNGFDASLDPNGVWRVKFDSQLSDTQIAFKLGQMSVGVGGGNK